MYGTNKDVWIASGIVYLLMKKGKYTDKVEIMSSVSRQLLQLAIRSLGCMYVASRVRQFVSTLLAHGLTLLLDLVIPFWSDKSTTHKLMLFKPAMP